MKDNSLPEHMRVKKQDWLHKVRKLSVMHFGSSSAQYRIGKQRGYCGCTMANEDMLCKFVQMESTKGRKLSISFGWTDMVVGIGTDRIGQALKVIHLLTHSNGSERVGRRGGRRIVSSLDSHFMP